MVFCPACGYENDEDERNCLHCGRQLKKELYREKILEHFKYSSNILQKYPKIIIPDLIQHIFSLITGLYFIEFITIDYTNYIDYIIDFDINNINYQTLSIMLIGIMLSILFDSIYRTFKQHILLIAIKDNEPNFNQSFLYAKSRYTEFIKAHFISVLISTLFLTSSSISFDDFIITTFGGSAYYYSQLTKLIVLTISLFILLMISYAISIMVYDETSFMDALRIALYFFRAKFGLIVITSIIQLIIVALLDFIPYGNIFKFIPYVFFTLVNIDIFLSYKKQQIQANK